MKIAAAYETLGDENKRILYDATYTKSTGKADASRSYGHTTTPTTNTYDGCGEWERRNREEHESKRLRRDFFRWMDLHQWHINRAEEKVIKIRSEIEALDTKDTIAEGKLAQAQSWFTPWSWGKPVISDEEKQSMESERLNRQAARTVKQGMLLRAEIERERLKDQKRTRETAEANRMREEQRKKHAYEQAEQAKQEAQWRKEQERLQKQREAQENATREYMERLRKSREAQEQAKREERKRQEAEQARMQASVDQEARRMRFERECRETAQRSKRNKAQGKPKFARFNPYETNEYTSSPYVCTHKGYWGKKYGRHQCLQCEKLQSKFAFQCPGCNTIACYTCMNKLRIGEKPMPTYEYYT